MNIKLPKIKISKRQSQSLTKSRPLEHIFHNPILTRAHKKEMPSPKVLSSPSVKILELKLPIIAVPKFFNNCFIKYSKALHTKKVNFRTKSVVSELYIDSTSRGNRGFEDYNYN